MDRPNKTFLLNQLQHLKVTTCNKLTLIYSQQTDTGLSYDMGNEAFVIALNQCPFNHILSNGYGLWAKWCLQGAPILILTWCCFK